MSLLTKKKFSFISLSGQIPDNTFAVVSFTGYEAISKPYEFELTLVSESLEIDPLLVLQNPAKFTIHRNEGEDVDFNGILMQFEETQEFNGYLFFKAVLVPKLWWLSLTHHNQVFLDLTVEEIMESALKDGGLAPGIDFEFRLQEKYEQLEYVCQYGESHLNFVARWAEREGIYYFFEQTVNGEKVIFTDTKISHADLLYTKDLFYHPQSGLDTLHTKEVIKNFICRHNMLPMRVYLKDYNYLKPSLAIEGVADVDEEGRGENYIYGEHFSTPEQANRLAKIRAEELKCRKSFFIGESSVPFMVPGFTFDLKDHYRGMYNRKYLICDVTHEGHQTGYLISGISAGTVKKEEDMFYANSFTVIYSDSQFRSVREAVKPKISGTITAKIDAASSGKYAELDEYGRYKVILPFDRSGRFGGKASAWFRMMQPYAGQNQGMHFPLHKGTEVMLTFLDGDPDRPIIAGAVPNPETASPVTSANQTRSGIKTGRSPEDRSVGAAEYARGDSHNDQNYIEFEDNEDHEYIKTHSPNKIETFAGGRYKRRELGPSEESGHDKYNEDGSAEITTSRADLKTDELIDTLKSFAPGNVLGYDEAKELDPAAADPPQGFPEAYIVAPTPSVPETFKSFIEDTPDIWCYTDGGSDDYDYHKLSELYKSVEQAWEEYWKYWVSREHSNAKGYENPEYINHSPEVQIGSPWFIAHNWDVVSPDERLGDYRSESDWDSHCRTEWDKWVEQKIEDFKEWQPHLFRGHIRASHRDTFNIQEGNIYDFGGYWNYNLGNCYVEEYLDQSAELNKTRDEDLLDPGGPYWTEVDWSKAEDDDAAEGPSEDDIKIGSDGDWDNSKGSTNVWVEKKKGRSYEYSEVDSIEVTKGSSLEIQHGGKHVEMGFRSDGTIKSWNWSKGSESKEKKWLKNGNLFYESWKEGPDSWERKRDRNTNVIISYSAVSNPGGGLASFDYCFCAKASAKFDFGFASSFSFSAAASAKININFAADFELTTGLGIGLDLDLRAGGTFVLKPSGGLKYDGIGFTARKQAAAEAEIETLKAKIAATDLKNMAISINNNATQIKQSAVKIQQNKADLKNLIFGIKM